MLHLMLKRAPSRRLLPVSSATASGHARFRRGQATTGDHGLLLHANGSRSHGAAGRADRGFDALRLRDLLYPIYEFVWTQNVIRPKVSVSKTEENVYYRNHPEQFVTPRTATVRYIMRQMAPEAPRTRSARARLDGHVGQDLRDHPQLFEEVARQYSQAPNAESAGWPGRSPADFCLTGLRPPRSRFRPAR